MRWNADDRTEPVAGLSAEAKTAGNLPRRLRVLTHPALLVVDEMGYLPVSRYAAALFFQLVNARHERASTVLTSNKGFEERGAVLGDEVMPAALIDRLLHHSHIVNIRGNSYRMREHRDLLRSAETREAPPWPPCEGRASHPVAVDAGSTPRPKVCSFQLPLTASRRPRRRARDLGVVPLLQRGAPALVAGRAHARRGLPRHRGGGVNRPGIAGAGNATAVACQAAARLLHFVPALRVTRRPPWRRG